MQRELETTPLSPAVGVEVRGVDLREPMSSEIGAELRALFFQHRLVLFRGQELEAEHQIAFMSLISKVITEPARPILEAAAIPIGSRFGFISNTDAATYTATSNEFVFHADLMYAPQGAIQGVSLYAIEMEKPSVTSFANMVNAAACLPVDLRSRVEPLFVVNVRSFARDIGLGDRRHRMGDRKSGEPSPLYSVHPIIERHPVTGDEYIDVSEMMSSNVVGWDDESSDRLFEELAAVSYHSQNMYRHEWRLQDFVAWDNIALQHAREQIHGARTLRRVIANPYELATLYAAAEAPEWEPARR
jgi:taurine dioxygenase